MIGGISLIHTSSARVVCSMCEYEKLLSTIKVSVDNALTSVQVSFRVIICFRLVPRCPMKEWMSTTHLPTTVGFLYPCAAVSPPKVGCVVLTTRGMLHLYKPLYRGLQ